jgi:four helix bundle protein
MNTHELKKWQTTEELKIRFKRWAIQGVLFTRKLPYEPDFKAIKNQMVRCMPSAAANYRSACRAKSNADFINKLKIVEEELDESMFWLEFITELYADLIKEINPLHSEANQLIAITVASINTLRKNQKD